jgi:hypothetical protein
MPFFTFFHHLPLITPNTHPSPFFPALLAGEAEQRDVCDSALGANTLSLSVAKTE